jgi:glyoxylase-like metal-dependent hydrolase (beta-lactamase superfamily II)
MAEGVFAALATNGGSAISNAGIINLGDQIVVFDTFLTPQAAKDLRSSVENLFESTPNLVINSHYHNDHIWGNQVFDSNTLIISSTQTRQLIATAGMEELEWYSKNSAQKLEALLRQSQDIENEREQFELTMWIGYYEALVEAIPYLSVHLPNITFDNRLAIHGSGRTAELITFEGGHTGSDLVLYLPEDGIIFMSDLLFVRCHPYLADGDPFKLLKALGKLGETGATTFVPGHGPIGTLDDLKRLVDYVELCHKAAQALVKEGPASAEMISGFQMPEKFRHWQLSQFYQANIQYFCQILAEPKTD